MGSEESVRSETDRRIEIEHRHTQVKSENTTTEPPRKRFQFSLLTMMIATALFAVVCAGLFAGPVWFTVITIFYVVLLVEMVVIVAIIYSKGYLRTFCIGALFPSSMLAVLMSKYCLNGGISYLGYLIEDERMTESLSPSERIYYGAFWLGYMLLVIMHGLVAMGVRRMVEGPLPIATQPVGQAASDRSGTSVTA